MPRINATRAEHAARRAKAAKASAATAAHYAAPGVWDAERAALVAERDRAAAAGDDTAVRRANNSLIVLNL